MMKRLFSLLLVFCSIAVTAQRQDMVVKVKRNVVGTYSDGTTVELNTGEITFPIDAFEYIDFPNHVKGLRAVDLGLSVMWANINYEAKDSTDVGTRMTWNEMKAINFEDAWGDKNWRVPTYTEIKELISSCKFTSCDNPKGFWVSRKDGTSNEVLFLPATNGYDYRGKNDEPNFSFYWSSDDDYAALMIEAIDKGRTEKTQKFFNPQVEDWYEDCKLAIRPVYQRGKQVNLTSEVSTNQDKATVKVSFSGDVADITGFGLRSSNDNVPISRNGAPSENPYTFELTLTDGTYSYTPYAMIGDKEFTGEPKSFTIAIPKEVKMECVSGDASVTVTYSGNWNEITRYGIEGEGNNPLTDKENTGKPDSDKVTFTWPDLAAGTYGYRAVAYIGQQAFCSDTMELVVTEKIVNDRFPVADKVDMGLSVMWSSWNMGADRIYDYGKLIGWGDPTGTLEETNDARYGVGITDSINISGKDYDIAYKQWGDKWRMPTIAEIEELMTCEYEYIEDYEVIFDGLSFPSGVSGWMFYEKGKAKGTGNSIFLPQSGYRPGNDKGDDVEIITGRGTSGSYWTSELSADRRAWYKDLTSPNNPFFKSMKFQHRSIRPVYGDLNQSGGTDTPTDESPDDVLFKNDEAGTVLRDGVDLGLPSGKKWARWNIGANRESDYGNYYAWGDTQSRTNYSRDEYAKNVPELNNKDGEEIGTLPEENDAAAQIWKNGWRMPTEIDLAELQSNTIQEWASIDNVEGLKFSSKADDNHNFIFFPACGYMDGTNVQSPSYGYYWTKSSFDANNADKSKTYGFNFNFTENFVDPKGKKYISTPGGLRYQGYSIRPIHD